MIASIAARVAGLVAGVISVTGAAGQVQLRAEEALPAPEVIAASPEGLLVGKDGKAEYLIGWDRVLRLEGPLGAGAEPFLQVGRDLWRARTRLERGDAPAAEAMFERVLPAVSRAGPMAAVAAEGLLRCRLDRGAQVSAIEPWLIWLENVENGRAQAGIARHAPDWAARAGLDPVADPQTGLIPALPPIWLDWPAVRALGTGPAPAIVEANLAGSAAPLAALYHAAAAHESGIEATMPAVVGGGDGVALVADIVRARGGSAPERAAARDRLAQRIAGGAAPWMEAWCRAAIGRSLVREDDPETRSLGVIQMLHLPARFGADHAYLAGVCLAEASAVLAELGDDAGAARLHQDLLDQYPEHPVLEWSGVRVIRLKGSGAGAGRAPGRGAVSLTTEIPSP